MTAAPRPLIGTWYQQPGHKWHYVRPGQRIVVFSGYSAQDARARFAGKNLSGFLQKPFSADALRTVLSQIRPA